MANQGLHGSHRAPLEALANMGIEIISNLGRTLRGYSDRYAQKITPDDMIKRALQEVVNTDAADLEGYVRNRVERHCSRLEDMLRKVKAAYESQMHVSLEYLNEATGSHLLIHGIVFAANQRATGDRARSDV